MKFILARSSHKKIPEASGIYIISCRQGRRFYIGSTFNFRDRFGKHLSKLIRKKHPNRTLQKIFDREQVLFFWPARICSVIGIARHEQEVLDKYLNKAINAVTKVRYYRRRKRK